MFSSSLVQQQNPTPRSEKQVDIKFSSPVQQTPAQNEKQVAIKQEFELGGVRAVDQQVLTKLGGWLEGCPDPQLILKLLERRDYLKQKLSCGECGEDEFTNEEGKIVPFERHHLRFFTHGPISNSEELICKDCWEYFQQPTFATPEGVSDPWPATFVESEAQVVALKDELVDGELYDGGIHAYIGKVWGYNPAYNTAHKVALNGMEDQPDYHAEFGSFWQVHPKRKPGILVMDGRTYIDTVYTTTSHSKKAKPTESAVVIAGSMPSVSSSVAVAC
jgi:hypothetical protein